MNTGRIFGTAALAYGAMCLVPAGLSLVLGAIFVALNESFGLAQALLLTGVIALAPVLMGIVITSLRPHKHEPPAPVHTAESFLKDLGSLVGKEASEIVRANPWHTILAATIAGFLASSNPKLFAGLRKTLGL